MVKKSSTQIDPIILATLFSYSTFSPFSWIYLLITKISQGDFPRKNFISQLQAQLFNNFPHNIFNWKPMTQTLQQTVSFVELFVYVSKYSPQQVFPILHIGTPLHPLKPDTRELVLNVTFSPFIYNSLSNPSGSTHTYSQILLFQLLSFNSNNHLSNYYCFSQSVLHRETKRMF